MAEPGIVRVKKEFKVLMFPLMFIISWRGSEIAAGPINLLVEFKPTI